MCVKRAVAEALFIRYPLIVIHIYDVSEKSLVWEEAKAIVTNENHSTT